MIALLNNNSQNGGSRSQYCHVRIIEVRNPRMPLATSTTDVVQVPTHCPAVDRHIKDVFGDAHGLDARMQDIIFVYMLVSSCCRYRRINGIPVLGIYPGLDTRARLSKKLS